MDKKSPKKKFLPSFSSPEILNVFRARKGREITFTEIARALEVASSQRKDLHRTLQGLIADRQIVRLDRRHYGLPAPDKVIVGRVQAHRDGYGFLVPEEAGLPDIFLGKREVRDLMHRDRVALHLGKKGRGRSPVPRTLEVLERAHRRVVGRFEVGEKYDRVIPDDYRLVQEIRIPKRAAGGAVAKQIVLAEIMRYPTQKEGAEGRILQVLGDADDPRLDSEIIIHKFDLPDAFSPAVLREASAIPPEICGEEIASRVDLRGLNFFTVDGETARDFDDAVSISRPRGGHLRLRVAIADVSHYVKEGSTLDKEAFRRGTSVYFPDRALPMLPPHLSSGICSLNPAEDRLCLTADMEFDGKGRMIDSRFYPSVIHSQARLTYTLVKEMLLTGDRKIINRYPSVYQDLRTMAELCMELRGRRMERGSIDFDLPEPEVVLDVQGQIEEIVRAERHIGHQIIEEFMIATNEAVARFLDQDGSPGLHRVHEPPDAKKMEEFKEFVAHLGYRFSPRGNSGPKISNNFWRRRGGSPKRRP